MLVGGSVSSTERAPSMVELFAEGEHHAVGRTEIGDTTLDKETSLSTELYIRKGWNEQPDARRYLTTMTIATLFIWMRRVKRTQHVNFDCKQHKDAELSGYELDYQTNLTLGGPWNASLSYSSSNW